jgi:glycosyltransferase involved in cell wall biosynthesis
MAGGGGERAMLNLASGLADHGYSVDLVLATAEGPYMDRVHPEVRVVDLRCSRVVAALPGLVSYMRRERPSAIVASQTHAAIVAVWARAVAGVAVPLILNEQTTLSPSAAGHVARRLRDQLLPTLARHFYPRSDAITAVSQGVKDDLVRVVGVPEPLVRVIFNPVVTPELLRDAKAPCDHPWLQPGAPPVILAAGRLTVQKDFPMLLRAFSRVRARLAARLIIIGEGEDRPQLEGLAASLGVADDVELPGFVRNPFAYMARASLFALSSQWEGLPTVLIEAMACGAPIVATDCPSGPYEILAGGRFGRLAPVGDDAAFAQAALELLQGRGAAVPEEGWRRYEMRAIADQYTSLMFR